MTNVALVHTKKLTKGETSVELLYMESFPTACEAINFAKEFNKANDLHSCPNNYVHARAIAQPTVDSNAGGT